MSAMDERRASPRRRTRLRPGKLIAPDGRFLGDCAIMDRSETGVRVRRFGGGELPEAVHLLDEREGLRWPARTVWQDGGQAGLSRKGADERLGRLALRQMAGPYYAVR